MSKARKIIFTVLIVIILIPVTASVVLQFPGVQTRVLNLVGEKLSENIDGRISIGKVYYSMPNRIILKDICLTQNDGRDTVFFLDKLLAHVSIPSLANRTVHAKRIALEDGQFNIWHVNDSTTNLSGLFGEKEDKPKEPADIPQISVDKVTIRHFDFSMLNPFAEPETGASPNKIDWDNLIISDICLEARNVEFEDNLRLNLGNISFRESHGLVVSTVRGDLKLRLKHGIKGVFIDDFQYADNYSALNANTFSLRCKNFSDFSDFCNQVSISADLEGTYLDFRTLDYYAGLHGNELKLIITGDVNGPVANLRSSGLEVSSDTGETKLDINFKIAGLPDIHSSFINLNFKEISTNTRDIANILGDISPASDKSKLDAIAAGEQIRFRGAVDGFFDDLVAHGNLTTSNMGFATLDMLCRLEEDNSYTLSGHFGTDDLDIGGITDNGTIGKLTCEAGVNASLGERNTIRLDSLRLDRFGLLDYDYSNVLVDGTLTDEDFSGTLTARDPNLDLDFAGTVTFKVKDEKIEGEFDKYKFKLALNKANLDELMIDKRDSEVSLKMDADINVEKSRIMGDVSVNDIRTVLEGEKLDVGDINLKAYLSEGRNLMRLTSTLADARFRGTASIIDFVSAVLNGAARSHLSNVMGKPDGKGLGQEYSFSMTTGNLEPAARFFLPGLKIAEGTGITLKMDKDDSLDGSIKSGNISLGKLSVDNMTTSISGTVESLQAKLLADRVSVNQLAFLNDSLRVSLADNKARLHFGFINDEEGGQDSDASINATVEIPDQTVENPYLAVIRILPSDISLRGSRWQMLPSTVKYRAKHISLEKFELNKDEQMLSLDGTVSDLISDTLNVRMRDFDIAMADILLSKPLGLQGTLTGSGRVFGLLGETYGMLLNLDGKEIVVKDDNFGDFNIRSRWNDSEQRFNLSVRNRLEGRSPIDIRGYFYPEGKRLSANAEIDRFGLSFAEPLLSGIVSNVEGSLSGKVSVEGPLDKLKISSEKGRFNGLGFILDYTKVPYTLDGPFTISEKGVQFNGIDITDEYGQHGKVNGGISYNFFKDISLNTSISLNRMLGLNTGSGDNSTFFGTAFATGTVRLTGPMDKIRLAMNLTTEQNTSIHIKLGSSGKERKSLLTFVGDGVKMDEYDSLRGIQEAAAIKEGKQSSSELQVDLKVNATPDAEIVLDINTNTGDVLKARGSGLIDISAGGTDEFSINGEYNIREGNFLFNLMGITSKDFLLEDGSSISFNGDIMQSVLDLTATYRTKASIGTLVQSSSADNSRRTVDCQIGITDRLSNPQIGFNIDIPDLDPTSQTRLETMLNTEDKRMRQVLALLVSGSFVPESESGIVNNTTILYSNASEIMSNQLNNIFRQLDIPVDLGFNYQPSAGGKDMFDVAISTKLFNNRVTINGNLGNRRNMTAAKSDFVGDVDVEVKVDRTGKLKVNAFSHSTDEYSNFLDQAQRNGVGMNYQEDFDTFTELFRKIFWSKEKKEQVEREEALRRREAMREMMEKARKEKEKEKEQEQQEREKEETYDEQ